MNTCEICSREVNIKTDAHYAHTRGWAKVRSQGGTNAITNPIRDGRLRCGTCVDGDGQIPGQEELF